MEIEGNYHNVYVIKRPGVDQFMKRVGELYEVVVFTASVSKVSLASPPQLCFSKWGDGTFPNANRLFISTATRSWISSTFTR